MLDNVREQIESKKGKMYTLKTLPRDMNIHIKMKLENIQKNIEKEISDIYNYVEVVEIGNSYVTENILLLVDGIKDIVKDLGAVIREVDDVIEYLNKATQTIPE